MTSPDILIGRGLMPPTREKVHRIPVTEFLDIAREKGLVDEKGREVAAYSSDVDKPQAHQEQSSIFEG